MEENVSYFRILTGALIYIFWAFLIGYFIADLMSYAAIIAAIGAGIYAGHKSKVYSGTINGIACGALGGIAGGIISMFIPSIAGIPLSVSIASFLIPVVETVSLTTSMLSVVSLTVVGLIFGGLGGMLGSIKHLRGMLLLVTMFLLFIFYGAVDNAAWNINKEGWTWNMSFSHVLTNRVDLLVAIAFAVVVTILSYTLDLFK